MDVTSVLVLGGATGLWVVRVVKFIADDWDSPVEGALLFGQTVITIGMAVVFARGGC